GAHLRGRADCQPRRTRGAGRRVPRTGLRRARPCRRRVGQAAPAPHGRRPLAAGAGRTPVSLRLPRAPRRAARLPRPPAPGLEHQPVPLPQPLRRERQRRLPPAAAQLTPPAKRIVPGVRTPMPAYRSRTSTHGRNMAGARSLWRATGMKDGDFGKPIIAVANSFTQFVPGHVHLKDLGQLVAREIEAAGGVAKEFNTIAVDDGIAMGHGGMLYSLPSRELIADSVEYMANAHCADALVCISNCDK